MPLPVVPKPLYPIVPFAPGVPAVLRSGAAILDTGTLNKLGIGDALDSFLGTTQPKWGVYDSDGNRVIFADSVESFSFDGGSRISNYPIEGGKFSSYNKVADPYSVLLRMACGSAVANRVDFLQSIEQAANSLELYTVITPEATYINANVASYSYRRDSSNGANKIVAEIHIVEVRQVDASDFGKPKQPTSDRETVLGQVQPVGDVNFDPSEFV